MKRCPQCHRFEQDEALKFCRVDGATLVSDSSTFNSEAGTAQLGSSPDAGEVHTSILPHSSSKRQSRWIQVLPAPIPRFRMFTVCLVSIPKASRRLPNLRN